MRPSRKPRLMMYKRKNAHEPCVMAFVIPPALPWLKHYLGTQAAVQIALTQKGCEIRGRIVGRRAF